MMLGAKRSELAPFRFPVYGENLRKGSYLAVQWVWLMAGYCAFVFWTRLYIFIF